MKISRAWATPLTIGCFTLMAVTGLAMFFHVDRGLNRVAHEWLSWVMLAGVGLHVGVNLASFKRYFSGPGRGVLLASAAVLAASFLPSPRAISGPETPMLALRAVTAATVRDVAALGHRAPEALLAALQQAGFPEASADSTLDALARGDRGREARLLEVALGAPPAPH